MSSNRTTVPALVLLSHISIDADVTDQHPDVRMPQKLVENVGDLAKIAMKERMGMLVSNVVQVPQCILLCSTRTARCSGPHMHP